MFIIFAFLFRKKEVKINALLLSYLDEFLSPIQLKRIDSRGGRCNLHHHRQCLSILR